jgi:hypothetical protein
MDATFLLYFFAPPDHVGTPKDSNDQSITMAKERVRGLIEDLEKQGATIIVATPAVSEIMVRSGVQAGQSWLSIMNTSKHFKVVPFDAKSAIEVALIAGHALAGEGGKDPDAGTHAKLKYDRQIVAIAKTEGASVFYTDDRGQRNLAQRQGMTVRGLADLPIPTTAAQGQLALEVPDGEDDED